jgi:hypothetical protein
MIFVKFKHEYSHMTSLLSTKKGSPDPSSNLSLERERDLAVPIGSTSFEHVILIQQNALVMMKQKSNLAD